MRRALPVLLFAAGVLFWHGITPAPRTGLHSGPVLGMLAAAVVLGLVPATRRAVASALDRLREPSPRTRFAVAFAVGGVSAVLLACAGFLQDRPMFPVWHDEQSYIIQARMLGQGRLWMPQHPLADFFESFYLVVRPVYASMYFPGTALLHVPGVWLGLPTWVVPVLTAGAVAGLVYRIVAELVDGACGLLAVLVLLASVEFAGKSTMVLSQIPMMLMGLLATWCWLRWRDSRKARWAALCGAFLGWGFVVRMSDAPLFALPLAAAFALDLRGRASRDWLRTAGALAAAALPFVLLQLVFDAGVTGSPLSTPHGFYTRQFAPQATLGFHDYDPALRPAGTLPQKQALYDALIAPEIRRHQPASAPRQWLDQRFDRTFGAALPHPLLLGLFAAGLAGLRTRTRLVVFAALPLFIAVYALYAILQPYYPLVAAPAILACAMIGLREIENAWPAKRPAIAVVLSLAVVAVVAGRVPEWNRILRERGEGWPTMQAARVKLPEVLPVPSAVLFRFEAPASPHEEPVYNTDAAWPDDCPILYAHDLGPARNREIFEYYANIQPDRRFFRFDRATGAVEMLGTARDLAPRTPTPR